jgi:hypothetical protein
LKITFNHNDLTRSVESTISEINHYFQTISKQESNKISCESNILINFDKLIQEQISIISSLKLSESTISSNNYSNISTQLSAALEEIQKIQKELLDKKIKKELELLSKCDFTISIPDKSLRNAIKCNPITCGELYNRYQFCVKIDKISEMVTNAIDKIDKINKIIPNPVIELIKNFNAQLENIQFYNPLLE